MLEELEDAYSIPIFTSEFLDNRLDNLGEIIFFNLFAIYTMITKDKRPF